MNLASSNSFVVDLHFSLCENHAVEAAGDDDVLALDLTLDPSLVAQDQYVGGNQQTFDFALDTKSAGTFKCSLKPDTLVEKSGPFGSRF
jgi:hypothetical protein